MNKVLPNSLISWKSSIQINATCILYLFFACFHLFFTILAIMIPANPIKYGLESSCDIVLAAEKQDFYARTRPDYILIETFSTVPCCSIWSIQCYVQRQLQRGNIAFKHSNKCFRPKRLVLKLKMSMLKHLWESWIYFIKEESAILKAFYIFLLKLAFIVLAFYLNLDAISWKNCCEIYPLFPIFYRRKYEFRNMPFPRKRCK